MSVVTRMGLNFISTTSSTSSLQETLFFWLQLPQRGFLSHPPLLAPTDPSRRPAPPYPSILLEVRPEVSRHHDLLVSPMRTTLCKGAPRWRWAAVAKADGQCPSPWPAAPNKSLALPFKNLMALSATPFVLVMTMATTSRVK